MKTLTIIAKDGKTTAARHLSLNKITSAGNNIGQLLLQTVSILIKDVDLQKEDDNFKDSRNWMRIDYMGQPKWLWIGKDFTPK